MPDYPVFPSNRSIESKKMKDFVLFKKRVFDYAAFLKVAEIFTGQVVVKSCRYFKRSSCFHRG
ncbi:MAG: hypothetical protein A2Y28_00055 [Chlamydiae bacterium GWC2_50_10]|nr:MAG: hypothetical protein A2098_02805 [Chlamydiae bacterium GWF2_49_8]OGN54490.1 MAG: hypothetical protein A2Y28_00055 [Chlamydiae bacterium GWC2_50_10]OGN57916.1 MAG: hypothetical protein A3D18_05320 [Chlamydiae bacterium RIFCSPHIGHO2_02_FULL_49_29]OGN63539.1 MAG: hypothetical protein A3E26_02650 [Chlamydiae bacterium RIFCSPHIGHO2_12_FULL_49_32]OGN68354.1 MAG: hypothetical protein A3I15_04190 [Chlamydiae bacterium RIFCSPLOWO2_02_FULL_49_12]HBW24974.1 hypothetical protein [Holosporales bact